MPHRISAALDTVVAGGLDDQALQRVVDLIITRAKRLAASISS